MAVVIILHGIWAIVVGLNLVRAIDIVPLPGTGDPAATGWAMVVVGILDIVVGVGLFTLKTWAWGITLLVLGITVLAGIFALIQHGLGSDNLPNLVPAVVAAIVMGYLLSARVRALFEPEDRASDRLPEGGLELLLVRAPGRGPGEPREVVGVMAADLGDRPALVAPEAEHASLGGHEGGRRPGLAVCGRSRVDGRRCFGPTSRRRRSGGSPLPALTVPVAVPPTP